MFVGKEWEKKVANFYAGLENEIIIIEELKERPARKI